MASTGPDAGWYPDPGGGPELRFWDGEAWTEELSPASPERRRGRLLAWVAVAGLAGTAAVGGFLLRPDAPADVEPAGASDGAGVPVATATEAATDPSPSAADLDPDDPANYVANGGRVPPLVPDCSGLLGLCLGNPIELAVERLGTEDYRHQLDEGTLHQWELDGLLFSAEADGVGSIVDLTAFVDDGALVTTPLEGVVLGSSTFLELTEILDASSGEVMSAEGESLVTLSAWAGPEGSHLWEGGLWVGWDDPAWPDLPEQEGSADALARAVGDRSVSWFSVGYHDGAGLVAQPEPQPQLPEGEMGRQPSWVDDTLAEARGGYWVNDGTTWRPGATLNVVTGSPIGGASGRGMYAFFFVDGRGYIGTDALEPSQTVAINWVDDTTVALDYQLYREGDPGCCPTGGTATVRFWWDGDALVPLDEIPPLDGPVHR